MDFKQHYRQLFDLLGHPLTKSMAIASPALSAAEKSLGVVVPSALRAYYAVAGNEKRLNRAHNRLLPIKDWYVDKKRLVFMEENQDVVLWGVSVGNPQNEDPPVSQSVNDDELQWSQESRRCSVFLAVMLHYQVVSGGFKHYASAPIPTHLKRQLKSGWACYGTLNGLTAYSRQNQVVCIEPMMGVLAAGKSKQDLLAIETDLGLALS